MHHSRGRVPLVVLASIDRVVREVALASALVDRGDILAVVHDIDAVRGVLTRRVLRGTDMIDRGQIVLEHLCPSCAVREDAVPVIERLLPEANGVIVALPVTAEVEPASIGLSALTHPADALADAYVSATLAVVDVEDLPHDLLGDEEVHERDARLGPDDDRTVAEALLGQLPVADAVLVAGSDALGADLVNAVRAADSVLWPDVHGSWLEAALAGRHQDGSAARRARVLGGAIDTEPSAVPAASGAWTSVVRTSRAVHPARLLEAAERIVDGPTVCWGRFWVPDRPRTVCGIYGAGRRVAIGVNDDDGPPETHIRLVGWGDDRAAVERAVRECLLTPTEAVACPQSWLEARDELEPFLGPRPR